MIRNFTLIKAAGVLMLFSFTFLSCSKQAAHPTDLTIHENGPSYNGNQEDAISPFNKYVGAPIPGDIGRAWIGNYKNANGGVGASYTIISKYLYYLLGEPNCVGICMYYAKDDNGKTHILPVGVDNTGTVIKVPDVITQDGEINWATAQKWISQHLGAIDAHFFGSNTFEQRLLADGTCEEIKIDFATDNKKQPQLLLSNAKQTRVARYEDASFPCDPTHVPKF